jgi:hypothetical protein
VITKVSKRKTKHAVMTEEAQKRLRDFNVGSDLEELALLLVKYRLPEDEAFSAMSHTAYMLTLGVTGKVLEDHGVTDPNSPEAWAIIRGIHAAEADEAASNALEAARVKLGPRPAPKPVLVMPKKLSNVEDGI